MDTDPSQNEGVSADRAATAPADQVDCSVLVPVLNEESHIERTVAAMCGQRFPGVIEFLFADGGSSDRTREILDSLAERDPRIRIFDNPNRSVSSGLNVALRHARGRWVARMDAHTEYPADYLALGVERLQRGGTRWVSGPQIPKGDNAVSRAVALALRTPLGRGGSRKWGVEGNREADEITLDSGVFAGVWERATVISSTAAGMRAGHAILTPRWPAGFSPAVSTSPGLPAMGAAYTPRGTFSDRGVSISTTACTERRPPPASAHLKAFTSPSPGLVLDTAFAAFGPRRIRPAARLGLGAYVATLASVAARSCVSERNGDALLVPFALAVMHFAHGAGFILGVCRYGLPLPRRGSTGRPNRLKAAFGTDSPCSSFRRNAAKAGTLLLQRVIAYHVHGLDYPRQTKLAVASEFKQCVGCGVRIVWRNQPAGIAHEVGNAANRGCDDG